MKYEVRTMLSNNKYIRGVSTLQISLFLFLIFLGSSNAQDIDDNLPPKNIKVGLVLSGGGALGIAHIGVIQALEEEGIPIDLIAGTSMGSIVGGLYASGYSSSEMRKVVEAIDWKNIFNSKPDWEAELLGSRYGILEPLVSLRFKFWEIYIPPGLNNGQRISNELFYYTSAANFAADSNFDNLSIPYRAIAVDTLTGEAITLENGELTQAIRSSMAIPLVFHPTLFQGRLLIDGGVINNLPTDVALEMGSDIVIACDVNEVSTIKEFPKNFADIAQHTLDITFGALKKNNVKLADVLIEPDLSGHQIYDYSKFDELIAYGYKAAMEKMDEIKLLIPLDERNRNIAINKLEIVKLDQALIRNITVAGLDHVRKSVLLGEFILNENEVYDTDKAIEGVNLIYATGLFENVWLELDNINNTQVDINIHVIEKYPRAIGFGVNYQEQEGPGGFVQIIHYNLFGWGERFMPFVRYGNLHRRVGFEIVNDRFLSTPVTMSNGFYFEQDYPYLFNDDGVEIGQFDMERVVGQFSIGAHIDRKLLFMAGLSGERIWLSENQQISISADMLDNLNVFGKVFFDNTDDRYFPYKGISLSLNGKYITDIKFSENPYIKIKGDFKFYLPVSKKQTISTNIFAGTSIDGLPVYEKFRIGGPFDFPGYQRDELWSEHALIIGLNYRLNLFRILYLQTNFSIGNVTDLNTSFLNYVRSMSAGLSIDLPIGPVSVIYGWNDDNREQLYLSLGYDF